MSQAEKIANRREKVMSLRVMNPWMANAEIAESLGVSPSAVSRDFEALEEQDKITFIAFPAKGKYIQQYDTFYVFIETSYVGARERNSKSGKKQKGARISYQREMAKCIRDAILAPEMEHAVVFGGLDILLGGPFDILLKLYGTNPKTVHDFVIDHLRSIPYILKTSTAWKPRDQEKDP